jgi:hypothetical protein
LRKYLAILSIAAASLAHAEQQQLTSTEADALVARSKYYRSMLIIEYETLMDRIQQDNVGYEEARIGAMNIKARKDYLDRCDNILLQTVCQSNQITDEQKLALLSEVSGKSTEEVLQLLPNLRAALNR